MVADERLGYDARAAYVEARIREWRLVMHARTQQAGALGFVDARRGDAAFLPQTEDAALDHFHAKYTEVRELKLARENHAAIVASSYSRRPH